MKDNKELVTEKAASVPKKKKNLGGRPKGSKNKDTLLREMLYEMITEASNG